MLADDSARLDKSIKMRKEINPK